MKYVLKVFIIVWSFCNVTIACDEDCDGLNAGADYKPIYQWAIGSFDMMISFYTLPEDKMYSITAYSIVYQGDLTEEINDIGEWIPFFSGANVFYLTSHKGFTLNQWYSDYLIEHFGYEYLKSDEQKTRHKENIQNIMRQEQEVNRIDVQNFAELLREKENIAFIIGAGMSAEIIPTLPALYKSLGLEEEAGTYYVTQNSLSKFLPDFLSNPEKYYSIISSFCSTINGIHQPTKAHIALKEVVDLLESDQKNVFIYSANLDSLEEQLHLNVLDEDKMIADLNSLTLVVLGLRNDHSYLINRYKSILSQTEVFSFNLDFIKMFRINKVEECVGAMNIDGHVIGDLQSTFPDLKDALKKTQ